MPSARSSIGRAAHRAGPAARRVPRRDRHRPARGRARRGRTPAPARVHSRCLARAADAALGDRGEYQPGADPGHATRTGTAPPSGASTRESKRMRRLLEDMLWLARFDATQDRRTRNPSTWASSRRRPRTASARSPRRASSRCRGSAARRRRDHRAAGAGSTACWACCSTTPASTRRRVARSTCRRPDGGRVALTVDDAGPGIPDAERRTSSTASIGATWRRRAPAWAWRSPTRSSARPVAAGPWATRRPAARASRSAGRGPSPDAGHRGAWRAAGGRPP